MRAEYIIYAVPLSSNACMQSAYSLRAIGIPIMQNRFTAQQSLSLNIVASVLCVMRRTSADAGPSVATGLAAETIPEDEPEEDAAPTPEQLEVRIS